MCKYKLLYHARRVGGNLQSARIFRLFLFILHTRASPARGHYAKGAQPVGTVFVELTHTVTDRARRFRDAFRRQRPRPPAPPPRGCFPRPPLLCRRTVPGIIKAERSRKIGLLPVFSRIILRRPAEDTAACAAGIRFRSGGYLPKRREKKPRFSYGSRVTDTAV